MAWTKLNRICFFACLFCLLAVSAAAQKLETLYHFHTDPANPETGLFPADDGSFYFNTQYGLFQVSKTGIVTNLFDFNSLSFSYLPSESARGGDGALYGISRYGGTSSDGTIFKFFPGQNPILLASFSRTNGAVPVGKLVLDQDGNLYGATFRGGSQDSGAIFKLTTSGILTSILSLNDSTGRLPTAGLVKGDNDFLYGLTTSGGEYSGGTFFKVDINGLFTLLYSFGGTENYHPMGPLVRGKDGNFYGIAAQYGLFGSGSLSVYKITPSGTFTPLARFVESQTSSFSPSYLTLSKSGDFYGISPHGGTNNSGLIFKITHEGALTVLLNLNSETGFDPRGELSEANDGNFYGTMRRGGPTDWGTVFKMTPTGDFTIIKAFSSNAGRSPTAILSAPDGYFYGTAAGGTNSAGIFFRTDPTGKVTIVSSLNATNGNYPTLRCMRKDGSAFYATTSTAALILRIMTDGQVTNFYTLSGINYASITGLITASDGNIYGVTHSGGEFGFGIVFRLTPTGVFTRLASFPQAEYGDSLLEGRDGNFYGTTVGGGIYGIGSIYKMTPAGNLSPVASFPPTGARYPRGMLIQTFDGTFYGTASANPERSFGAIFKLSMPGIPTTVTTFQSIGELFPQGDLMQAPDGNIYGTIPFGGINANGSIFKLTPKGDLTTQFSFGGQNGAFPGPPFLNVTDGNLYGVTGGGGLYGDGTIYRVVMAPSLKIDRQQTSLVFSWPTNFASFNLQSSTTLDPTTWTSETLVPAISDDQYTVTNSIPETKKFFRLIK